VQTTIFVPAFAEPHLQRIHEVVEEARPRLITAMVPGATGAEGDAAEQGVIMATGSAEEVVIVTDYGPPRLLAHCSHQLRVS
jgi:Xaa-Pro aminopeptidase